MSKKKAASFAEEEKFWEIKEKFLIQNLFIHAYGGIQINKNSNCNMKLQGIPGFIA